jgi:hypothetical protein
MPGTARRASSRRGFGIERRVPSLAKSAHLRTLNSLDFAAMKQSRLGLCYEVWDAS